MTPGHDRGCRRIVLNFQYPLAPANAGGTGAHGFQDRAAVDPIEKRIEFRSGTSQLNRVGFIRDIDDSATKDIGHAFYFLAILADRPQLYEHHFTLDMIAFAQIHNFDYLDQLVQLLRYLLDPIV